MDDVDLCIAAWRRGSSRFELFVAGHFFQTCSDLDGVVALPYIFWVSVFAGAAAGLAVHWGEIVILVGASAGVSGILGAAIPIMYGGGNSEPGLPVGIMSRFRPLTVKQLLTNKRALSFTAIWLGLTMLTATSQYMTGTAFLEERVIAWEAHLGGFVVGLVAFYILDRKRV